METRHGTSGGELRNARAAVFGHISVLAALLQEPSFAEMIAMNILKNR